MGGMSQKATGLHPRLPGPSFYWINDLEQATLPTAPQENTVSNCDPGQNQEIIILFFFFQTLISSFSLLLGLSLKSSVQNGMKT